MPSHLKAETTAVDISFKKFDEFEGNPKAIDPKQARLCGNCYMLDKNGFNCGMPRNLAGRSHLTPDTATALIIDHNVPVDSKGIVDCPLQMIRAKLIQKSKNR